MTTPVTVRHLAAHRCRDHKLTPCCSCGWTGETTRWSGNAAAQIADHLADVNAPPAPAPGPGRLARRYLGAGR
jgi:hypothetical protein